jgi:hypothetical protein
MGAHAPVVEGVAQLAKYMLQISDDADVQVGVEEPCHDELP